MACGSIAADDQLVAFSPKAQRAYGKPVDREENAPLGVAQRNGEITVGLRWRCAAESPERELPRSRDAESRGSVGKLGVRETRIAEGERLRRSAFDGKSFGFCRRASLERIDEIQTSASLTSG